MMILFAHAADKTWETVWESPPSYKQGFFVDSMNGWIVSDDGFIMHTNDGGKNWSNQRLDEMSASKVYFVNPDTGWCLAYREQNNAVFHTKDGGETWNRQELPVNAYLSDFDFCDNNSGWIVGGSGLILHTSDGGNTWIKQDSGISDGFYSVQAVDEKHVYAVFVSQGRQNKDADNLLYTVDGGERWRVLPGISVAGGGNIQFIDREHGYAFRGRLPHETLIYSTEDGGKNWEEICNYPVLFKEIQFIDDKHWWARSIHNMGVYLTEDGGQSWKKVLSKDVFLYDIHFLNEKEGWIIGDAVFHYADGEVEQVAETASRINCLFFLNEELGWAGGTQLLRTKDGGNSWESLHQVAWWDELMHGFFDLHFIDENVGWGLYMRYGPLVKTTDGGKTWGKQEIPVQNPWGDSDLFDPRFFFVTPDEFWIAGTWLGLHTKDNGEIWQVIQFWDNFDTDDGGYVDGFYFLNANNGLMLCSMDDTRRSRIYRTNDNGKNWNLCYDGNVKKLFFNSPRLGWGIERFYPDEPANTKWRIIRTDDGGRTWQKVESAVFSSEVLDILFIDENEGWIVKLVLPNFEDIEILHTVDGGNTFRESYSGPAPALASYESKILCYDGEDSVYAAWGRRIARYTDKTYSERAMVLKPWTVSPKDRALTLWGKVKQNQLYQNYPNPFNPETWIPFRLANDSKAVIEIYDITGRMVKELNLGTKKPGLYITDWDGTNSYGERVSSGVYFYTIRCGDFTETKRMILKK